MKIEYYAVILSVHEFECKEQFIDKRYFTTEEEAERYIDIHRKELFTTSYGGCVKTKAFVRKRILYIEEKAE